MGSILSVAWNTSMVLARDSIDIQTVLADCSLEVYESSVEKGFDY